MLQSACRRKKGGRSSGDPVLLTCIHMVCPGCPPSRFGGQCSSRWGWSQFVTPTDVPEEKAAGQSGQYALCLKYITKDFVWKCLQCGLPTTLLGAEAGFLAPLWEHLQTYLLRLNALAGAVQSEGENQLSSLKNMVTNPQNPNAGTAFSFFQKLSQSLIFTWKETRDIFNWKRPGCREGTFSPGLRALTATSWLQLP